MQEARRILGLGPSDVLDAPAVRTAYRRVLRRIHPDVNARPDAARRTALVTQAYEVLTVAIRTDRRPPSSTPRAPRSAPPGAAGRSGADAPPSPSGAHPGASSATPGRRPHRVGVRLLDDCSISVDAPAEETLMVLLDAAHDLGDISYLDRTAGLVEVIVEFVEAPTSSVLFSLQGRADGTTEVFCTVEPLSGGEAPPADAVTRLVVETLRNTRT